MNNKKGGVGAKILLVLILMIASAIGGAYGYRVIDGKLAVREAMKAVEDVDISDYDTAEQTVIQGYIDEATKNLETAKTRKEVYGIIGEFIADVDQVQTSNEKKLEEALQAAEEAKEKYGNQSQNNGYNSNNNSNNNNSFNTDSSTDNSSEESYDNSNSSDNSDTSVDTQDSGYKNNDLTTPDDGTEDNDGKGFLGSLLGGMSSGSNSSSGDN